MTNTTRDEGGQSSSGKKGQSGRGKGGARSRLNAERAEQAAADRRKRQRTNLAIAVVVALVAGFIIVYAVLAATDEGPSNAALPALVSEPGGGVAIGDGAVDVTLWEDFQCPACKLFEQESGAMLAERVDAGEVTLTIHPLSFIDQNLGNTSSVEAANALGCAADAGEQQALNFHLTVYANQPEEMPGQPAWTTQELIGWGNDVGIDGEEWESCVTNLTYDGWVEQVANSQGDAGITSTPTVFLDGEKFAVDGDLDAAIDEALKADQ